MVTQLRNARIGSGHCFVSPQGQSSSPACITSSTDLPGACPACGSEAPCLGPVRLPPLFPPDVCACPTLGHPRAPRTGDFISWAAPGPADPLLLVRREAGPSASARPVLELLGSDMGVAAVWMMRGGNRFLGSSGCSPRDTTAGVGRDGGSLSPPKAESSGPGAAPPGWILTGQALLPVPIAIQAGREEIGL